LVDFNNDGKIDIISGGWSGEVYLFRQNADGTYAARETIEDADGKPLKVTSASVAYAADWDGDGDLDLLIGDINGEIHLATNDGTRDKPAFHMTGPIEANGGKLRVAGGDAGPIVADWDGDGKPDLLVGCGDGSVQWFRNVGEKGKPPQLAAGVALVRK